MKQYIDKSAVVEEIKKEIKDIYAGREYVGIPTWEEREIDGLEKAIEILNTLEVKEIGVDLGDPQGDKSAKYIIDTKTLEAKEVDLDFEIKEDWMFSDKTEVDCLESMCLTEDMFVSLAKKYFELGIKAKGK